MCDVYDREASYQSAVCGTAPSCALALLVLWEFPHSPRALRFANHALVRAFNAGCDVLEYDGIKGWIR